MLKRRVLQTLFLTALISSALATALTFPASAELRTFEVRLSNGSYGYMTVDVPPGTPTKDIELPGIPVRWVMGGGRDVRAALRASRVELLRMEELREQRRREEERQREADSDDPADRDSEEAPDAEDPDTDRPAPRPSPRPHSHHPRTYRPRMRRSDGSPARSNPGFVDALPSPSNARGVPNFIIRKFRVPIFLLPIYQAAGIQYGIRWEYLAAINEIETDYGRNLNVSSAGAVGWMQFLPSTWRAYGVDANKDKKKDPYNPVDAIFAAARYLKAAGAPKRMRKAIFAYNHADWYVDQVVMRAKLIAGMPPDLVGSLTGLTEGRFPVYARARYADDLSEREMRRRKGRNAARIVSSDDRRRGIEIYAKRRAPVVATNDGVIKRIGRSEKLGRYVILQDVYGNSYTYSGLDSVSRTYPAPKTDGRIRLAEGAAPMRARGGRAEGPSKQRLFAHPNRPNARAAGGLEQLPKDGLQPDGYTTYKNHFARPIEFARGQYEMKRLRRGSRVIGGTILGRLGRPDPAKASHLYFEIRPAGRGAPRIDPKPILDGWKLLESTAIYRATGRNILYGKDGFSIGQVLLLPKPLLERRVLSDNRIDIYPCGRSDIRAGQIDRRVLATMAYLAEAGLRPTVTSLKCGHGFYTASGSVSHHSSGNALDIARINGISILGHQERGGITEQTVRRLMLLQGTMRPAQIISLLDLGDNTFRMGDHADHIHVGFRPLFGSNRKLGRQALAILKPGQWNNLMDRLGKIENPVVRERPSRYAISTGKRREAETARSKARPRPPRRARERKVRVELGVALGLAVSRA